MKNIIVISAQDNIGNAIEDIAANEEVGWNVEGKEFMAKAREAIPFGFKMALRNVDDGEAIIKYGQVIGYANGQISQGECVHVHNINGGRGRGDLEKSHE